MRMAKLKEARKETASAKGVSHASAASRVYKKFLPNIQKRDGRIVPFEFDKIAAAIGKAMLASNEGSEDEAIVVAHKVAGEMMRIAKTYKNFLPTVEGCQDEVERQLMLADYVTTAKSYIIYRAKRAEERKEHGAVPEHVKKLSEESKKYFKGNLLGEFVYLRTYARWVESEQRRETWIETVDRYVDFMKENLGDKLTKKEYAEVREAVLKQEVMPSMRAMQFAGAPARKCNTCFYNCSFTAPVKLDDFAEIMYLSMQGCGVGYSVESYNVQQLPQIEKQTGEKAPTHVVADTKEGWCDALTLGLKQWYAGKDVEFDFSHIRPAGARLKTMGGKASGPEPLRSLLGFARERILRRQGRRLRNIDAHDIICKIGECVVAGGVRRTAMISLSDLDDAEIRDAKKGQFFLTDPYRSVANNSAVYEQKPTNAELMDEWVALMKSGTGERGIFNRGNLETTMPERRIKLLKKKYGKKGIGQLGTNPCGEIILQSKQFCNLSEVIARPEDDEKTLIRKTRLATAR
jgi:ribonucleoside-diphosphate reductase alpha chain